MINTSHINLLDLIGTDTTLKRVANTNNGEYHGPCPFCGGKDRFIVQPFTCEGGRWSCRQCTPRWQDAIAYVMRRDTNGSFKEALKVLELSTSRDMPRQNRPMSNVPGSLRKDYPALNEPGWQAGAQAFVTTAKRRLWSSVGLLTLAARILVAFDADENKAGDVAADWWLNQIGGTAKRLTPTRHDVTDMVLANDSLDDWLASAI